MPEWHQLVPMSESQKQSKNCNYMRLSGVHRCQLHYDYLHLNPLERHITESGYKLLRKVLTNVVPYFVKVCSWIHVAKLGFMNGASCSYNFQCCKIGTVNVGLSVSTVCVESWDWFEFGMSCTAEQDQIKYHKCNEPPQSSEIEWHKNETWSFSMKNDDLQHENTKAMKSRQ